MKIPKDGFTLEDICRLAGIHGVYIHIGVAKPDVARHPPRITMQVSTPSKEEPRSFAMDVTKGNQYLNKSMSANLLQYVEMVAPGRMKIILPGQ